MINVCVYACLHFVHMCRRWERAGWGYCYFSEDMMSHCTSHTHTRARIQSGRHTRRVSLRITVAFCGRRVQTMTGKQEPQHNEREQGPSLIHTHTHTLPRAHTHTQRAVGFTPSPSLSITQQAFSATLLHYSKLPRALSHLETCDCVWMCVYVGGCGCLTEVAKKCVCARVCVCTPC